MTCLSPAVQAVMHTYEDWLELPIANQRYGPLAAALRAAADHVYHDWSGFNCVDYLCEIADELERAQ